VSDNIIAQQIGEVIFTEVRKYPHPGPPYLDGSIGWGAQPVDLGRAVLESGLVEPRRHATGVVHDDRLEVRQLRTELGQARTLLAEIRAALARIDSDAACVPACVSIGRILNA
jgi:hypothetical protein